MTPTAAQILRGSLADLRDQWQQLQQEEAEHAAWEERLTKRRELISERMGDIILELRDAGEPETEPA